MLIFFFFFWQFVIEVSHFYVQIQIDWIVGKVLKSCTNCIYFKFLKALNWLFIYSVFLFILQKLNYKLTSPDTTEVLTSVTEYWCLAIWTVIDTHDVFLELQLFIHIHSLLTLCLDKSQFSFVLVNHCQCNANAN